MKMKRDWVEILYCSSSWSQNNPKKTCHQESYGRSNGKQNPVEFVKPAKVVCNKSQIKLIGLTSPNKKMSPNIILGVSRVL